MPEYVTPEEVLQSASARYLDPVAFNENIQQIKSDAIKKLDSKIREFHSPIIYLSGITYCLVCFEDEGSGSSVAVEYPCPTIQILEEVKRNV